MHIFVYEIMAECGYLLGMLYIVIKQYEIPITKVIETVFEHDKS